MNHFQIALTQFTIFYLTKKTEFQLKQTSQANAIDSFTFSNGFNNPPSLTNIADWSSLTSSFRISFSHFDIRYFTRWLEMHFHMQRENTNLTFLLTFPIETKSMIKAILHKSVNSILFLFLFHNNFRILLKRTGWWDKCFRQLRPNEIQVTSEDPASMWVFENRKLFSWEFCDNNKKNNWSPSMWM